MLVRHRIAAAAASVFSAVSAAIAPAAQMSIIRHKAANSRAARRASTAVGGAAVNIAIPATIQPRRRPP